MKEIIIKGGENIAPKEIDEALAEFQKALDIDPASDLAAGSNVIGVSLPLLRSLLRRIGVSLAALWADNPC